MTPKEALNRWLVIFGEHYRIELTAANVAIYHRGLCDLSLEQIEEACSKCLTTARFLPTLAEIRSHITKREQLQQSDLCLIEWEAIVKHARTWHPDVGFRGYKGIERPGPELSARALYALRAVGGRNALGRIAYDDEAMVFRKRDFEAAYSRHCEMETVGCPPISESHAKQLLGKIENVRSGRDTVVSLAPSSEAVRATPVREKSHAETLQ